MSKDKTPKVTLPETLPARKALIAAAKDMNAILSLDPKIKTKDRPDADVARDVYLYGKGFDEESGEINPQYAVSFEDEVSRKLSKETFETLIALGVLEAPKVKTEKVKKGKKVTEEGDDLEVKKSKGGGTRNKGVSVRGKTWKDIKAALDAVDFKKEPCLATKWDAMLCTKRTLGEHAEFAKANGFKPTNPGHIAFRVAQGYQVTDKRKHRKDESGVVYFTGFDPEAKGTVLKFAEEPPTTKKAKRIKDDDEEAPKTKKVKKAKVAEPVEEPVVKKAKKVKEASKSE